MKTGVLNLAEEQIAVLADCKFANLALQITLKANSLSVALCT